MIVYGVDVGLTGAIALAVNGRLIEVADIPAVVVGRGSVQRQVDAAGVAALIRTWRSQHGVDAERAVIERVAARPGQGVASMFSLGHSAGTIQAVFATLGVPVVLVAPQTWKRAIGGIGKDKAQSQAAASRLFPEAAGYWLRGKDHNRAEAALLAAYGAKQ